MGDPLSTDERLNEFESRLSMIERALNLLLEEKEQNESASQKTQHSAVSTPEDTPRAPTPASRAPHDPMTPWSPAKPITKSLNRADSPSPNAGNWLGAVGAICFVLAAAFIVRLAIDSGWLTPERQIGAAILMGFGLIGTGFWLKAKDVGYASLLPGAGIAVLYLSILGAHSWHKIVPFNTSLGAIILISGLCIWLYTRIRHDIYPVAAAVGTYVAPLLLGAPTMAEFSLYYFVACSIAFATISIYVRSRILTIVASYLAIVSTTIVGLSLNEHLALALVLPFIFLTFIVGTVAHTITTRTPLTETEAWSFLPALFLFYGCEYNFILKINPALAPWISLAFAAVLWGAYFFSSRWLDQRSLVSKNLVFAFVSVVLFHALYLEILTDSLRPWLFPLIAIGAAMFSASDSEQTMRQSRFAIPILSFILLIEYLRMTSRLLEESNLNWLLVSFASVASIYHLYFKKKTSLPSGESIAHPLLGAAHVLAILGLYNLFKDSGSLAVSLSWLLYAAAIVAVGVVKQDGIMAKSALFALTLAAAKALVYDAASAPTLVRIACLLLTGATLYACGYFLRRIESWDIQTIRK
jgi:uncharacterized membrane protein